MSVSNDYQGIYNLILLIEQLPIANIYNSHIFVIPEQKSLYLCLVQSNIAELPKALSLMAPRVQHLVATIMMIETHAVCDHGPNINTVLHAILEEEIGILGYKLYSLRILFYRSRNYKQGELTMIPKSPPLPIL